MTRSMCGILSVLTLAAITVHTSALVDPQRHPNFSGIYTLLPDRSVAIKPASSQFDKAPSSTSGRTVVGSCGTQFAITQTATQVTIRVVSGDTPARRYYLPGADGIFELDHSTTMASSGHSKQVGILSWRGAALDLVLTQYNSETPAGRVEYVFRSDPDDTITAEFLTSSSARDILHNASFVHVTSVYQRSMP